MIIGVTVIYKIVHIVILLISEGKVQIPGELQFTLYFDILLTKDSFTYK